MSRPSAIRPGASWNARWRISKASRTAGSEATIEAPAPTVSVRMTLLTSSPSRMICCSLPGSAAMNCTSRWAASCLSSSSLVRSTPWLLALKASRRYSAPESSSRQPSSRASSPATVPFPEPLGPSMVMTGAWVFTTCPLQPHECRLRHTAPGSWGTRWRRWRSHGYGSAHWRAARQR
ncbi:hypothetical protein D3C76_936810 [compost metagenome]